LLRMRQSKRSYADKGKLLICGNGGSAADADHIVGELMKEFCVKRPLSAEVRDAFTAFGEEGRVLANGLQAALPAISLTQHTSLSTAYANDEDAALIYAQQVIGYGRQGDAFLGISTSGNARNVCNAALAAKALGLRTIGLTAAHGGKLVKICDSTIRVPETETYKAQELHLPIYHALCIALEAQFFGVDPR